MEQILKGKKLLYLGGISRARWVVMRARELGVYVIVADYNEDSPAKAVADEAVLVDAMNVDALVALGREKKIDGVMTGYCDILLPVCKAVAERLRLPCYMTDEMIKMSTDKDAFKNGCERFGVPVPKKFDVNYDDIERVSQNLKYPVFIKPLDASGSRGASACDNQGSFKQKFEFAQSFSKKGLVSVEEMLTGIEFILDYAIIDGVPHLLSMADRYITKGRSLAVNSPNIMIFPSRNLNRYRRDVEPMVINMLKGSGFKNGILFFQGYASDNKIAFYEMGCRLGGTWPYIDEYFYNINPMDMLFRVSLTGKMMDGGNNHEIQAEFNGNAAIIYFLSEKMDGRIGKIKGVDEVKSLPYVVNVMPYYNTGDRLCCSKQVDIRLLSVHLVADNFTQLQSRVQEIYSMVNYYDENGESILAPVYDTCELIGY